MESNDLTTNRRAFLGTLATGAAAMSFAGLAPLQSLAKDKKYFPKEDDPDAWFNRIKGKHRIVFDVTEPHGIFPFAWPRVFLITNAATGTPEKDNSVVVVLRHAGIPYAMNNKLWEKYKFGEMFNIKDDKTKTSAVRNAFWQPGKEDFMVPGIGAITIGINELQESGVMFCVCNAALTVYSAAAAQAMGANAEDVKKEWMAGLLPGIQVVPSGVWALGRAQEKGCGYIFVR